jgi:hypothetical protein
MQKGVKTEADKEMGSAEKASQQGVIIDSRMKSDDQGDT